MKKYRTTCDCEEHWKGKWFVQPTAALEELQIHNHEKHSFPQNLEELEFGREKG